MEAALHLPARIQQQGCTRKACSRCTLSLTHPQKPAALSVHQCLRADASRKTRLVRTRSCLRRSLHQLLRLLRLAALAVWVALGLPPLHPLQIHAVNLLAVLAMLQRMRLTVTDMP